MPAQDSGSFPTRWQGKIPRVKVRGCSFSGILSWQHAGRSTPSQGWSRVSAVNIHSCHGAQTVAEVAIEEKRFGQDFRWDGEGKDPLPSGSGSAPLRHGKYPNRVALNLSSGAVRHLSGRRRICFWCPVGSGSMPTAHSNGAEGRRRCFDEFRLAQIKRFQGRTRSKVRPMRGQQSQHFGFR